MTLYAIPFTCSFAAHLGLRAWQLDHQVVFVDRATRLAQDGTHLTALNPKDRVSTLVTPERVITENCAVLLHLATRAGVVTDLPSAVEHVEWLSFIATELHKRVMAPVHRERTPTARRERLIADPLPWGLDQVEARLASRTWLVGDRVGPADLYLVWVALLTDNLGVDLGRWPAVRGLMRRVLSTQWARAAIAMEQAEYAKAPRIIDRAAASSARA